MGQKIGVRQIVGLTGVSSQYVRQEIWAGRLPAVKVEPEIGSAYYAVEMADFEKWRDNPRRGQVSKATKGVQAS